MTDAIQQLRQTVRDFAEQEIGPRRGEFEQDGPFPAELWGKLGQAGLLGITIEPELGGRGLNLLSHCIVMEELSRASASVGISYAAHSNICLHNLNLNATPEQRQRYIPGLCDGSLVGALAMTEPEAGSDIIGSMQCHAKRQGDVWIANGEKKWITNAPEADVLIVYMNTATGASKKHELTAFIIDRDLPGFSKGERLDKLGMRGSNTGELLFNDCRIPAANVLGEPGQGIALLMQGLDSERLLLSAGPIGIMQAAMDIVLPFIRERVQFGQPIGRFQLIQAKMADMYTRLQTARAWSYRVAEGFDQGVFSSKDAASCYLYAAEAAVASCLEAIQTLGARGYLNDADTARLLRDAKVYDIGGGTNEIRRLVIGRELFEHGQ